MAIAPQKDLIDAPQQQPDVMGAVARKGKKTVRPEVQQAKEQIREIMKSQNMSPDMVVRAGKMAELAIRNKAMYPAMVQLAVKERMIEPNQIGPGIDYKFLASVVSAGRIAQMIIDEGGL